MRWSFFIAVIGLSITDVASFAQGPPDGERLSTTHSETGYFASAGLVRFQLIQGRLFLDCPRHRKGSQNRNEDGVYESITVTAERGIPSLHYVLNSEQHHLTLSVKQARVVRMESWFVDSDERAVLEQPELGQIRWTQTHGDIEDQYEGTNLLHLRHANASTFDSHFGLLIKRVLRGTSLQSISSATQRSMLEELSEQPAFDFPKIAQCVEQLRSGRRSDRIKAERQLLSWGTPVTPALHQLIDGDIDQEQRQRLRLILRRLRPSIDDTPATLAKLLVNDRAYWERIASGLSGEQLQLTNLHLRDFGTEPVELVSQPTARIATARD